MKIKELAVGELDARYEDFQNFNDEYILLPENLSYKEIVENKNLYYLIGNKGTGKTALLLYIGNKLKQENPTSICSTILFKTKYDSIEKKRLESLNNRIFETLEIDETELETIVDFKNIWKLEIYFKIVYDNKKSNYSIFENDINWNAFEDLVRRLTNSVELDVEESIGMIKTIPKMIIYNQEENNIYMSQERVLYPSNIEDISLQQFNTAVKILDGMFGYLKRRESPYYICIDELETSFSSESFNRDIRMIRDWVEIVWFINGKIKENSYDNMKVLLSVRSEILKTISRELFGDEINKKTGSYGQLIEWRNKEGYFTTRPRHLYAPVIQIMLKKIMISSNEENGTMKSEEFFQKWFEPTIAGDDTSAFIYERTWGKPRDAVRFLSVAKQYCGEKEFFDKNLIIQMQSMYSNECRKEIYEEMSACYSNEIVNDLFATLDGYKSSFSIDEYYNEVRFSEIIEQRFSNKQEVAKLLFSFGVLGCKNEKSGVIRWVYNGDEYEDSRGWRLIVHPGLRVSLNLEEVEVNGVYLYDAMGTNVQCVIHHIKDAYMQVSFEYETIHCQGNIHISKIRQNEYIENIRTYFSVGETITAYIIGYDTYHKKWELSCFVPR